MMKRRGGIWMWQSWMLPQIGGWLGLVGSGTISHDRMARTKGSTGIPHQLRRGEKSMPTVYDSGGYGVLSQTVPAAMSWTLTLARPTSVQSTPSS